MKTIYTTIKIYILIALLLTSCRAFSQASASISVINFPCRSNGIVAVNISNMVPPFNIKYSCGAYHAGVMGMTDTLYNCPLFTHITIEDALNDTIVLHTLMDSVMPLPHLQLSLPVCPDSTAEVTLDFDGYIPDTVFWIKYNVQSGLLGDTAAVRPSDTLLMADYFYSAVDTAGCFIISDYNFVSITQKTPFWTDFETVPADCNNGSIRLLVDSIEYPPLLFEWSNGMSDTLITNLAAGFYSATITDSIGCKKNLGIYLPSATNVNIHFVITPATCNLSDGAIYAFTSGGHPPFQFHWNDGSSAQHRNSLQANSQYQLQVIDSAGCSSISTATVGLSTPINVTYSTTPCSCLATDGKAILNISGATAPFTVNWNVNPPQTGDTLKNVTPGIYSYTISDAIGCSVHGTIQVKSENEILDNLTKNSPICPQSIGSLYVNPSGSSPPYSLQWNTGSTSNSIQATEGILYTITITDAEGCYQVNHYQLSASSPIHINFSLTPSSCLFTADGNALALVSGGQPPYQYSWSNGSTGGSLQNAVAGNYWLNIIDTNGCNTSKSIEIPCSWSDSSCFCLVRGIAYYDVDGDCIKDSAENGIQGVSINIDELETVFTDINGEYISYVPDGTYTIREHVENNYPLSACQNEGVVINASAYTGSEIIVDFANSMGSFNETGLVRYSQTPPILGFPYTQILMIKNTGSSDAANVNAIFLSDSHLSLAQNTAFPYQQIASTYPGTVYSILPGTFTLPASTTMLFFQNFDILPNTPLGQSISSYDTIVTSGSFSNWLNDYSPWDNVSFLSEDVVSSYDPNYKEVQPRGKGDTHDIFPKDSVLTYIIHFQNTGTYYAQKVVVEDTLDPALNAASVKPFYSDHTFTTEVNGNGVVRFTFDNIMLPWKDLNEELSNGVIIFTVHMNRGLSNQTVIKNTAYIYFDFNEAIITNTVFNTLTGVAGVEDLGESGGLLRVYPIPAQNFVIINQENGLFISSVELIDLTGRILLSSQHINASCYRMALSDIPSGVYILKSRDINGKITTQKLVKLNP